MANIFSSAGKALIISRLMGSGTEPKQIGWGTGAGTSAVGDTTLFTEKAVDLATGTGTRVAGTSSAVTTTIANDTHQVVGTLTATGAGTVTNAGTFDNATIGSGNLFLKGDFTGIALAIADAVTFTFKYQQT
ncbi:hypothetical protein D3Y57_19320 [Sphingomonas paeninsulae]|uniref:Uncharacterized protein n=1 Tax=Sphingomonas paeninsulae TaxID=2319844 RepID=A0A494TJJ5_SPHPE|nr:hypothetical protein [Sphingomonas paeninsulae]AYJ87684.1 hypothetical protein D3Y57_19320 [Sphingomonas paeninsulae]